MRTITLTTDFGLKDPYVGMMKGMILSTNPEVRIVDITHGIDPQDVREGAFIVAESNRYFEKGTIHIAVVDPTVGSDRRPIVFSKKGHFFIGPDNGVFTLLYDETVRVYALENHRYMAKEVSSTFHGRDIFAPAAAYLAFGVQPSMFGRVVEDPVHLSGVRPLIDGTLLQGEIVRFDGFGNAITNISKADIDAFCQGRPYTISLQDRSFSCLHRSYCEAEITCLIGSAGYVEFGLFKGNLKRHWALEKGEKVYVAV